MPPVVPTPPTQQRSGAARGKPHGAGGAGSGASRKQLRSLKDLYLDGCRDARVHPNSVLLGLLPDRAGLQYTGEVVDLSRNYIGDRGVGPLLLVVQRTPHLRRLVLCENGLRNNAVKLLCAVASSHPALLDIDLSDNYISEGAGQALLQLVEENPRIQALGLDNTKIPAELRVRIKDRLDQNRQDYR